MTDIEMTYSEENIKNIMKNLERIEQMLIMSESLLYDTYNLLNNVFDDSVEEFETKRVVVPIENNVNKKA